MPIDQTNTGDDYLVRISDRTQNATFQRILDEMAGGAKETTGQGTGPGVAEDKPAQGATPKATEGGGFFSKLGDVAKNTAYGAAFEVVPQIVAGRFDAVRNAARAVNDFGDWINANAPWLVDPETVRQQKEFAASLPKNEFSSKALLGIGGEPTTGIGQFAREASKFMTFYTPAAGALGSAGLTGFMAAPTAGAISQFLSQDPNQAGISNLLEKFPTLQPIFSQLAAHPDDEAINNRLKHAVEGLGVGVAAEGITRGLKAAAHWMFAKPAAQQVAGATPEMTAQAQAHAKEAEVLVGAYDKGITRGAAPFAVTTGPTQAAAPGAAPQQVFTRRALEQMDTDALDKMAFGVKSGDVVTVNPSQIKVQYPSDLANPQDKFAKGGMAWARSVDLSEPIKVDLKTTPEVGAYGGTGPAEMYIADGHHRWFAAQKLGIPIKAEIEVKAKPIEVILAKQTAEMGPGVPGQVTAGAIKRAASLDDITVQVNWQNIDKGNLRGFIGDVANEMKGRIQVAKRGTLTLKAQTELADALGMTNEDLLARGIGKAFNSDEIIAGGKLLNASQSELYRLAHIAEMPTSSLADAVKVNEQFVTHMGLLEQFLGGTGEVGRALGAMRAVHQQGAIARAQFMKQFLEATGGEQGARTLSSMLIDLEHAGVPPGAVNAALARASWGQFAWDAFKEAFGMGFLWQPKTHMRNIVGNVANAMSQSADLRMASRYATLLGHDPADMIFPQQAMAYQRGQLAGAAKAFSIAGKSFVTGERQFAPLYTGNPAIEAGGAFRPGLPPALSSKGVANQLGMSAMQAQSFAETPWGKAIDFIGGVTRVPGRFLSAEDDWFKVIGAEANAHSVAYQRALSEGLTGKALADQVAEYLTNRPPWLTTSSVSHADYVTFNNAPVPWGQAIMNLRSNIQPLFIALPYVRTPSNLFSTFVEHSPLAPILKSWRADIAAGGAAQELALARMTTGSIMMSLLADFAHNGHLTGKGPKTPAELEAFRGAGRLPYAFHLGKLNIQATGLGQLAPAFAFAGAVDDLAKRYDINPEGYETLDQTVGAAITIMAQSTVDQSYLQGFARAVGAITDSMRGQEGSAGAWARDVAGSMSNLIPGVPALRAVGVLADPQQRQIADLWDAMIFKNIPGLADRLIPVRDVFGHAVTNEPAGKLGALYNFISPFRLSWDKDHPAFNEMVRLNTGIQKIGWTSNFMGVDVNFRKHPEVLDYWRRLAGNELKYNPRTFEKIGLEDFLNAVVSGKHSFYSQQYKTLSDPQETGTDSGKATFIKHWANEYRQAAAKQVMAEAPWRFPEFYAEIEKGLLHKEQQRLRTFMPQELAGEQRKIKQQFSRELQAPLPDRFGRPSRGSGFTVPTGQ